MRGVIPALVLAAAPLLAGPAGARAADWLLEPAASAITFEARQGATQLSGAFKRFEAEIGFDPARPETARILVDVDVSSLELGDPKRRGEVLSQAGLNAAEFVRAHYETRALRPVGEGRYQVEAQLTLRGVTLPVAHEVVIRVSGATATAEGVVPVDRNAFGVGQGPFASEEVLAAEILVRFSIAARREGG